MEAQEVMRLRAEVVVLTAAPEDKVGLEVVEGLLRKGSLKIGPSGLESTVSGPQQGLTALLESLRLSVRVELVQGPATSPASGLPGEEFVIWAENGSVVVPPKHWWNLPRALPGDIDASAVARALKWLDADKGRYFQRSRTSGGINLTELCRIGQKPDFKVKFMGVRRLGETSYNAIVKFIQACLDSGLVTPK
jgi:hypothetical protein